MFEEMKLHRFLSTKIMTTIIRLSLIGMIVASFVGVGILSAQSSPVSYARPSARAKTTEIKSSYVPFISHPAEVARLIEQAAMAAEK